MPWKRIKRSAGYRGSTKENLVAGTSSTYASSKKVLCEDSSVGENLQILTKYSEILTVNSYVVLSFFLGAKRGVGTRGTTIQLIPVTF